MPPLPHADEPHQVPSHYWIAVNAGAVSDTYLLPQSAGRTDQPEQFRVPRSTLQKVPEMNANAIRAGQAFVELFADDSRLVSGLRSAQAKLRAFGGAISGWGAQLAGVGTAALAPFVLASKHFADAGDQLNKMAGRRLSVEGSRSSSTPQNNRERRLRSSKMAPEAWRERVEPPAAVSPPQPIRWQN
ncbi:MAG: hypothetical protein R3B90_21715 [Planctomycetaceae bacterium]